MSRHVPFYDAGWLQRPEWANRHSAPLGPQGVPEAERETRISPEWAPATSTGRSAGKENPLRSKRIFSSGGSV